MQLPDDPLGQTFVNARTVVSQEHPGYFFDLPCTNRRILRIYFWALVGTDVAEMLEFSTDIIVPQGHRLSMTLLSTVQADHGVLISSIRDPNWFLDIWLQKGSQGGCERDSGVQIDRRTPQTAGFSFSG